jgi:hypothetical protein
MTEPNPWHVTHTARDAQGNAGLVQVLGSYDNETDARATGEMYAAAKGATALHWRQFSSTTWGLMAGQVYTYILLSRVGEVAS